MSSPPHVYIIHLPRRTNRYDQFRSAWSAARLPAPPSHIHWYDAVEGIKLPPSAFTGFHTVARTRKARAGRLGAYLSHTGAIATAIAANHFPLLILEDDAVPTAALTDPHQLQSLFASAPSTANLLYFGALPSHNRKLNRQFCTRRRYRGWGPSTPNIKLYGGHAYGFRDAKAASHVLEELQKSRITFDSALVRYQKKHPDRVAVVCPFVFRQAEGYSNINDVYRPKGLGVINTTSDRSH